MKKLIAIFLTLVLCAGLAVSACASGENVFDNAELLTSSEEVKVQKALDEVGEKYDVYLYVLTVDSIGSSDPWKYAEQYYLDNDLGHGPDRDGVLFLVSMEYRDWSIYTSGVGYDAISNADSEDIGSEVASDLSSADYASAFVTFAEECEAYIDIEINGRPFPYFKMLFVALFFGAVVALIVTAVLRHQLKSVRPKGGASDYVRPGSMQVTKANEIFLYRNVTRRSKPKSSSSGGGGGGGSRSGGSSGKF